MTTKTKRNRRVQVNEVRYPDSIKTDNKGMVRVNDMPKDEILVIQGRRIPAGSIPFSNYTLDCGHKGQGIAVTNKSAFYCEPCQDTHFVIDEKS